MAARVALPSPDTRPRPAAELIAACAAFDVLEMRVRGLYCGPDDIAGEDARDAAAAVIAAEQEPFMERISALSATTLDGHRARVRSLATWAPDLGEGNAVIDRLLAAIIHDVA